MNKKNIKDFLNGKGFYVLLAVCLSVIIISAAIITVNNTNEIANKNQYSESNPNPDIEPAINSTEQIDSVLQNESLEIGVGISDDTEDLTVSNAVSNNIEGINNEETTESTSAQAEDIIEQVDEVQNQPTEATSEANESVEANEVADESQTEQSTESPNPSVQQIFLSFDENTKMVWPVQGDVIMEFSKDHTIYDKTLEQYRINESISIKAEIGTPVKAAANGTVINIINDNKKGYTIVLDHGNGWQTTYSQLQENVAVSQNQVVQAGDIIGGVAEPTKYSIALGSHLDFQVLKDGQAVNPKSLLDD